MATDSSDSRAVLGVEEEGGFLSSRKLSYDHSADEDPELHRLRSEFPDDEAVIRETWDSYVLEYSHRVKDFARFTRSIGDLQLKDPECAKKFNSLQNQCQITPFPTHDRPYVSNEPHVRGCEPYMHGRYAWKRAAHAPRLG